MSKRLGCILAATLLWSGAAALDADVAVAYPTKRITIVVPFPAGAGPDVIARLLGEEIAKGLGQAVVIENRPGASGLVGAAAVARADADGHTLLLTPNTLFIAPHVLQGTQMQVDVLKDLEAVIMPSQTSMLMVANPALGPKSAKELAELARTRSDISYASSGNGSVLHIAGELFKEASKVDLRHVAYRGIAPAINDVIAGHVHVTFSGLGPLRPHLQAGTLVALATVEQKRTPAMPQLATAIEQGFADVAVEGWYSILTRTGTPGEVVARLNKEVNDALKRPEVKAKIEQSGEIILGGTAEAAAKRIKADYDRYGVIVQRLKISAK
jgi:tripartite-type tricarboxylate transporter receptor subunit TctC